MNYKKLFRFLGFVFLVLLFIWIEFGDFTPKDLKTSVKSVQDTQKEKKIKTDTDGNLIVTFIDVGQADCILLRQTDAVMVIDAGNNEDGELIVNYLKEQDVNKIDYIIGTHAHEDHIGGLDDLIYNFEVSNIWMPKVATTTKTFEDVLDAVKAKGLKISTPNIGDEFSLGKAKVTVLHVDNEASDLNDTSIVLKVYYGETSYLFMGDASKKVEKKLLDSDIESDVLKVGHHGSQYSSSLDFLEKVAPKYAIISVGEKNIYDHPKDTTLEKLESISAEIYQTSELGTIKTVSDGNIISFSYEKTNTNG